MNTSLRLISSCAILGFGLSGLAACVGELSTEEDIQPVEEARGDEQTPANQGEHASVDPARQPERDPVDPAVIVDEAPMVNVLSLTCLTPSDRDGMDEPMIMINGKQRWLGAGFVAGTTEEVRYESVAFDAMATVELWEVDVWDDFTDPNDMLGFLEIEASAMGDGPQIDTVEARGGKYEVVYQVERCAGCSPGDSPPVEP